jgi:hypothetical protein
VRKTGEHLPLPEESGLLLRVVGGVDELEGDLLARRRLPVDGLVDDPGGAPPDLPKDVEAARQAFSESGCHAWILIPVER